MTTTEPLVELIATGEGTIAPIDPRMDREPAGSLLLGRAGAIRNAQYAALRQVIKANVTTNAAIDEAVERELIPRSSEFVFDRMVVSETRTDPSDKGATYRVEMKVVIDMRVLSPELDRLRR